MKNEKLIAQDFYFHPNGIYQNVSTWNSSLLCFDNDVEEISTAIRIYGTKNQIDKALDEFCNRTELNLDECYNFKVEPKGSYWYNIFGKKADSINKETRGKLKKYKKMYLENDKKPLVINLK
tara:strand:- start:4135 stop:4500 length:366 start_codon:yes stop_codon:yes gene_type:complete